MDPRWIQLYNGSPFWVLDPTRESIDESSLIHALALECRFGGHCTVPYSVGEHSVRVSRLLQQWGASIEVQLAGLLHDAPEGLGLKDLPRPFKHLPELRAYRELEERVHHTVNEKYGLSKGAHRDPIVKRADEVLLATERRDLMRPSNFEWSLTEAPLPEHIEPWAWQLTEHTFRTCLFELLRRPPETPILHPGLGHVEGCDLGHIPLDLASCACHLRPVVSALKRILNVHPEPDPPK